MALTAAERQKRWRENHPEQAVNEATDRKRVRRLTAPDDVRELARLANVRKSLSKPLRPFRAYDGEAIEGHYTLLAHTNEYVWNDNGLSTEECLDFLAKWEPDNPIRVFFSFEYDVTMILRDLPKESLRELMDTRYTNFGKYRIMHLPRRIFQIFDLENPKIQRKYFDTWGYFQTSFLKTIQAYWSGGLVLTPEQLELIEVGKRIRDRFTYEQRGLVIEYNHNECAILESIMALLRKACNGVGWNPSAWYGPGVLAESLLAEGRAAQLNQNQELWPERRTVNQARFGGRIELFHRGVIKEKLYHYDINSAYPYAISTMPDFSRGFRHVDSYEPGAFGLYHVSWNLEPGLIIGPLPYRKPNSSVVFPPVGSGWYHAVEVDAAMRRYPGSISVLEGWLATYVKKSHLTTVVERRYNERKQLKASGDFSQIAIKLALNASYGKLAQRKGSRRFVNLMAAGYITAKTRAMLLDATMGHDADIIAFATDGIISLAPLDVPTGDNLGEWEYYESESGEFFLPGIYRYTTAHTIGSSPDGLYGETTERKRGYFALDFEQLKRTLRNRVRGVEMEETRFIPYRLGIFAPDEFGGKIGTWQKLRRTFNPSSGEKRYWQSPRGLVLAWTGEHETSIARPVEKFYQAPAESLPASEDDTDEAFRDLSSDESTILRLLSETLDG